MSATFPETRPAHLGRLDWLRRELATSHERRVRMLILICGAALCVTLSMTLQVPELATSAYMVFFISKESKTLTTITGALGLICLTIGIGVTLLLYRLTYGHPELRIPSMAIALFLGMWLSRVLVIGPLGFLLGFIIAVTQSVGEFFPSPERLVRLCLWIWAALGYAVVLTVVLNRLFLPQPTGPPERLPKPKSLFVPDAFTNPAHVRFGLKVTLATMVCYIFYMGVDWFGIHTAFITCTFIALESTGATLRKGILRAVGCVMGGLLALFSIVFLIPHMETIASLVILVACVSAIAGWVATGTERIAYAGLQMAFAFFYGLFPGFQGFAPSTDLHELRDRFIGILLGLTVTAVVFQYVWPERAIDRLRDVLREALQQLARLLVIPSPKTPAKEAQAKVEALRLEISRELKQARREAELANFESEEPRPRGSVSSGYLKTILSRAEHVLSLATSLSSDSSWQEWSRLGASAQSVEFAVRARAAEQLRRAADLVDRGLSPEPVDLEVSLAAWEREALGVAANDRVRLVRRLVEQMQLQCRFGH